MYYFLEQLRGLKTATEQATQTFATSKAEELFHPQLEARLVTWQSNKLPKVVLRGRIIAGLNKVQESCWQSFTSLCFHSQMIKPNILAVLHETRLLQVRTRRMLWLMLRHGVRQFRCSRRSRVTSQWRKISARHLRSGLPLKHRPSTPVPVVMTQRPIKERAKVKEREE